MVPMKAKVNTFLLDSDETFIDPVSKCFVVAEFVLGLNRLPVLTKGRKYSYLLTTMSGAYSFFIICGLFYVTQKASWSLVWHFFWFQYIFCSIISFVTWKRTYRYYNELNIFDKEIGCRPKITSKLLRFTISMMILLAIHFMCHSILVVFFWDSPLNWSLPMLMMDITHCLEISYFGHLLSLVIPRLELINYYMELSVSSESYVQRPIIEKFIFFKYKNNWNMDKLMDLYQILIKTYDFLLDAIKWQLLVILISSFVVMLCICHNFVYRLMHFEGFTIDSVVIGGVTVSQMAPLLCPCIYGDRVHNEVRKLRELIASWLYENKLDKAGRSSARALLALTEARDLSFSLLRMLRVDVALPFKFIGLLVTYLIILLQFDKVIHPTSISINKANSTTK